MQRVRIAAWAGRVVSVCLVLGAAKVGGRHRAAAPLTLGCLVVVFAMAAADRAMAANECGAVNKNSSPGLDTAVCTATSGTGNPYAAGISYNENTTGLPVNDLTVELSGSSPGAVAVNASGMGVSVTGALNHNVTVDIDAGASVTATTDAVVLAGSGAARGSVNNQGTISGGTSGISVSSSIPVSIFDSGSITGGSKAIDLSGNIAGNTVALAPGFSITGNVVGQGTDTLQLGGTGTGTFDLSNIGASAQYRGFSIFQVTGGTWVATGTGNQSWSIAGASTLQLGNGASAGSITGSIADNGSLTVSGPGPVTLPGNISGTGTFAQTGGTVVLTGANTYSGATTISGGTLAVAGNYGTIGNSASVTLANSGAALDLSAIYSTSGGIIQNLTGVSGTTVNLGSTGFIEVNLSTSTTFAGVIQGTGNEDLSTSALMFNGNRNTLTLDGTNTYTGGTFVYSGTLAIGPGGSVASSGEVSLIGAGATLDISGGGNQTVQELTGNAGPP